MPVCKHCHVMRSTAEMRKSTGEGWLCKEKVACKQRVKLAKAEQLKLRKEP